MLEVPESLRFKPAVQSTSAALRTGTYADPMVEFRQLPFEEMCHWTSVEPMREKPISEFGTKTPAGQMVREDLRRIRQAGTQEVSAVRGTDDRDGGEGHDALNDPGPSRSGPADTDALEGQSQGQESASDSSGPTGGSDRGRCRRTDGDEQHSTSNEIIDALQTRMLNVGNALSEILTHIRHEPK